MSCPDGRFYLKGRSVYVNDGQEGNLETSEAKPKFVCVKYIGTDGEMSSTNGLLKRGVKMGP